MSDKSMADVADKALDKVSDLAAAAARVAPKVWDFMVRQQVVEGWVTLGTVSVAVLATLVLTRWTRKWWSEQDPDFKYVKIRSERAIFSMVLCSALWVCCFVALLVAVPQAVLKIANPEYYAAQALIQVAK